MTKPQKILSDLVSIDSRNHQTNKEIIDYLKSSLKTFDFQEMKYHEKNLDLYNLIVKIDGKSSLNPLVFIGHTDTVNFYGDWENDPFLPTIKNGNLYGLGSADMKAGLSSMITSANLIKRAPDRDIYLIFDSDEEGGSSGAKHIMNNFQLHDAEIIIPEPTNRKYEIGQKGGIGIDFKLNSHGKKNLDSIFESFELLNRELNKNKHVFYKNAFLKSKYSQSTDIIKLNVSIMPYQNIDNIYEKIKKNIHRMGEVSIEYWNKPHMINQNSNLIKKIKSQSDGIINPLKSNYFKGWGEVALFSGWGDALMFGPGDYSNCHKPNEFVSLKDLDDFSNIYYKLMSEKVI